MDWTEAWSQLNTAINIALREGMTEEEIQECVDNVFDENTPDPSYEPGEIKRPKKLKRNK